MLLKLSGCAFASPQFASVMHAQTMSFSGDIYDANSNFVMHIAAHSAEVYV